MPTGASCSGILMLRFYNTLSARAEEFIPLQDRRVGLYMCGPTVYGFAHIGNFRTFVFGDILQRHIRQPTDARNEYY
jgi:cysteinyl-tRNA synthetase